MAAPRCALTSFRRMIFHMAGDRSFDRTVAAGLVVALTLLASPALGQESVEPDPITVDPPPGTIALTFDDGPFEILTPFILEILARYDIRATFFISTYRLPHNAPLIQEILAAGHSVQSHGNLHIRLPNRTREEILEEVQLSLDLIVAAGAPRPTCFRPPYGATNEDVFSVAEELGLEVVLWTVASLDTVHQEPDGIIASTLAVAAPGDVVLMHDHWASAHEIALPIIIESLLEQGVGFGPICVPDVAEPPGLAPSLTRIMDLIG